MDVLRVMDDQCDGFQSDHLSAFLGLTKKHLFS